MGMTIAMPKNNASENITMNATTALPPVDHEADQAVQNVLAGKSHGLLEFSFQLEIGDDAAGKRE
jgi:hypothetical protein